MSDLRQQAIEAGSSAIYERTKGLQIRGFLDGREVKHVGTVVLAEDVLSAAEPFIRDLVAQEIVEWIRYAYAEDAADVTFSYYGLSLANDIERHFRGTDA